MCGNKSLLQPNKISEISGEVPLGIVSQPPQSSSVREKSRMTIHQEDIYNLKRKTGVKRKRETVRFENRMIEKQRI